MSSAQGINLLLLYPKINTLYQVTIRFIRLLNHSISHSFIHRRQSWGVWGSRQPRFWAGWSYGGSKGVARGHERVSEITIVYFCTKVCWKVGLFTKKRQISPNHN